MSQLLDTVEAQLVAVMESARGASGLGTDAAARYLPQSRYRRSGYGAPLRDPGYPQQAYDRAYDMAWIGLGEDPDPQNPLDSTELISLLCELSIGFAFGKETPQAISTTGTEVAVTAATYPYRRAVSEMRRILTAITFPPITCGTLSNSISIIECVREGDAIVEPNGTGRLIGTIRLRILIEAPTGTAFDP
jgi:hypothetical protein